MYVDTGEVVVSNIKHLVNTIMDYFKSSSNFDNVVKKQRQLDKERDELLSKIRPKGKKKKDL